MTKLLHLRPVCLVTLIVIAFTLSSCGVKNSWELIKLLTVNEPVDSVSAETVVVKNCGVPIVKTTDCSAGTTNDFSVSISPGVVINSFSIGGTITSTLGIGQSSGESVTLPASPENYITTYRVVKSYRVVQGEILAASPLRNNEVVNYAFTSRCSIDVTLIGQEACPDTNANQEVPEDRTSPISFDVSGKSGWQDTGIYVESGQHVKISYVEGNWSGRVGWGPSLPDIWSNADGIDYRIYYEEFGMSGRFASLIGKVGDGGAIRSVGGSCEFISDEAGNLFLRMFDIDMSDNDGLITVKIEIIQQ